MDSIVANDKKTSRIDLIGQNGNDGLHYKEERESQHVVALIDAHWKYVKDVLRFANTPEHITETIGFHYRSAMAHGWRHAKEFYTGVV